MPCENRNKIFSHVALRVGTFHSKSASYLIQCSQAFCKRRYNRFILCHVTLQDNLIEGLCKFMGETSSHCEGGYTFLICHVTSHNHMLKGLPHFMGGSFFCFWWRASGDMKYLVCHVTLPNHITEGSCKFMSGNFSFYIVKI